jgi:gliding motility-associated-like protein
VTQAADSIQLQFNNPGESTLTYTITNSFGCESNKAEKQIQILPLPEVQLLAADSLVCLGSFDSKRYEVNSSVMGSLFNWSADGGTIVAGGNSGSVTVNWFSTTETRQLMVDAFTPFGCKGAPIFIKIKVDSARPHLIVSTFANAENNAIEVSGSLLNTFQTGELSVERLVANAEFSKVGSINTSGSFTEDFTQAVEAAPTYRLAYINACKQILYSDAHTLNFLTATVVNDNKGISLSWSGYKGWENTIPEYEILLLRDNATPADRIASNLTGITFEYTDVKSAFEHCFIIQATQSSTGVQSNSNKVCINFNNPITVPNLVTMNADGINDVFFVDNLPLYPRSSLKILNRWGQEVFQSNDYQNNWPEPGSKLTNGTYFYQLKLQNGFTKKGWVQVVK